MDGGEKIVFTILAAIMGPIALFLLYVLAAIIPVSMYTEAECLRNGYPKSAVTVGLERYCMNLDGSVTVKVEKAGK
jgi:hypothetical protein